LACGQPGRLGLPPVHKFRIGQNPLKRRLDAFVEAPGLALSLGIELHQKLEVGGRRRTTERVLDERRNDRPRAGLLLRWIGRPAGENLATACRVGSASRAEGPFDRDLPDVWVEQKTGNLARSVHRALEWLVQFAARYVIGREERHANRV